ncbi:putative fatty acyl-CoA reductase CG5065 [Ceratina calcarata]|uniref:Fatty acyl-CoA reductase n=1 Tax=Ceratina calcarata TaxID=156304 RepID=A0AAJ7IY09_9HYME|nr:putative fatty acyl-CoA reductase CG5065 [Ceratina calcarata]
MSVHGSRQRTPEESTSVAAFYAGRSIFITGGTGFMGKVLVEKILRSCPDVREIFLLLRPKRGLSIDTRLKKLIELPLFDKLRAENPSCFEKLIPILGDVTAEGLGLPPVERRVLIERVSIIFHVAANVRFNENLKKDILSNTRSTRDICILAGSMKNLVALMHVSTAFCQSDKPVIEEILYPPPCDWRNTIKMVETLDEKTLQIFASKYEGSLPNTYTFSKRLAEQVINDYSKDLPCVIFRPSIVISTVEEPMTGWVDNFNGPVGMMIGGGKGILRVISAKPDICADFLPVDVAIKVMLLATWKRGLETVTKNPTTSVYNGSSHSIKRINIRELNALGLRMSEKMPLDNVIWYPRTSFATNAVSHYIMTLLYHVLPALFLDEILKLSGRKPMLLSIQKKIYSSVVQLDHFVKNEWIFCNSKMINILLEQVPPAEKEIFSYNMAKLDIPDYFTNCIIGAKTYLLHEDMSPKGLQKTRQHYDRMKLVDTIARGLLFLMLLSAMGYLRVHSMIFNSIASISDGSFLDL